MSPPQLHYDTPRFNATCIIGSLLCVCLYVAWSLQDTERLHDELARERRRRLAAEREASVKSEQMDGALEKIQELTDRVGHLADPDDDAGDDIS